MQTERTGTPVVVPDITGMTRQVQLGNSLVELRLTPLSLRTLEELLPIVAAPLSLALQKTTEIDLRSLCDLCREERATILIETLDGLPQGVCATYRIDYPMYSALEILAIARMPEKMIRYPNPDSLENLKAWARACGCSRIQGLTSAAVGRLWQKIGFTETARKMEIQL